MFKTSAQMAEKKETELREEIENRGDRIWNLEQDLEELKETSDEKYRILLET